ncbi:MAG: endo-1,3-alpha-glucanase family glycosylhydrolase [Pirellulales bacterium]
MRLILREYADTIRFAATLLLILAVGGGGAFRSTAIADDADGTARPPLHRKVYAHYMGCFVPGHGALRWHMTSGLATMNAPREVRGGKPLARDLAGFAKNSQGGTYRNFALSPQDRALTLKEAADLEIRRAMRIGVDGFTFDAWAGQEDAKELFVAMMEVCEENEYPFELTISPDANCLPKDAGGVRGGYIQEIKWLLDNYGDHPNLARRDGKPLIMGYQSTWPWVHYLQGLATDKGLEGEAWKNEVARLRTSEEGWKLIGPSFRDIERQVGHDIYWQYDISAFDVGIKGRRPKDLLAQAAPFIARDLPAVGSFRHLGEQHEAVVQAVLEAGTEWSEPMWLQYENYGYYQEASQGTEWIRTRWKNARKQPSTLMQYITWNDYHENTNLSPGINTRYAYFDLTGYFIEWWKTGEQPTVDRDKIYIFSHKYPKGAKIYPFKGHTRHGNVIEVLTILTQPATIRVPGRKFDDGSEATWEAPAGFSVRHLPLTPGDVSAELIRAGEVLQKLELPEPVTDRPFRMDVGKTAISTEFLRNWQADFGAETPVYTYSEYGDADNDGLPNWFEMLWFGSFGNMNTASKVDPDADPDGDGKSNLQEYLEQTDPTKPPTK